MPTIAEIRQQSGGAYDDMSDQQLGDAIHKKFYSDMPRTEFNKKVGLPEPEDVTAGVALRGIPFAETFVPKAEAAIRAAVNPGEAKGATWRERYNEILPQREAQYAQAEADRPALATALKFGGGAAALGPIGATATGARALGMSGPMATRMLYGAGSGAAISGGEAALKGESPQEAAKMGAGVGAAAPWLAAGLGRVVSPIANVDPERLKAIATLRARGVEPTAGQVSGNRPLQWAEQHLGEMSGLNPTGQIEEQLTRVPMRAVGSTATRATQEHVDDAFKAVGGEFDRLAAAHTLPGDKQLGIDIATIGREYGLVAPQPAKAVETYIDEIVNKLQQTPQGMPGDAYKALTSSISRTARASSDPELQRALYGLKGSLDSAMERHLININSPDVGAWQKVRDQYKNLLVLERAANKSSVTAAQAGREPGQISPAALYEAVQRVGGMRNMARGAGDYEKFARAASDITRGLPSSGTAQRAVAMGAPAALGGALGFAGNEENGGYNYHPLLYGLLGPMAAGRAINSRLGQAYLKNQVLGPKGRPAFQSGVQGGLLSLLQ